MSEKELEVNQEDVQLDEFKATGDASMVADPIATKSNKRPADKEQGDKAVPTLSRAGQISAIVQKLNSFSGGEVGDAYNVIFGKSAPDNSAKNKMSITPKGMKEDIDEIFGGEEFDADLKERAETIYTAAVNAKAGVEISRLEEEYAEKLEEAKNTFVEESGKKIDEYVTYAAEEWAKENEVAIESSFKVEVAENFMNGIKSLFEENYIDLPEEKVDLAAEAIEKTEQLESDLNESVKEKIELQKEIDDLKVSAIVAESGEGLTLTEREKLSSLAEGIEYDDLEDFSKKLDVIKENYFASKSESPDVFQENDEPLEEAEEKAAIDPSMERYASAITRTIKK
tara:strand:- start:805 stop:1827 length:1023 start_codon:yes stop_codon:yes gene_type:complete